MLLITAAVFCYIVLPIWVLYIGDLSNRVLSQTPAETPSSEARWNLARNLRYFSRRSISVLCEIPGSHGGEYEDERLLGNSAV
jgi:hypothetical protein